MKTLTNLKRCKYCGLKGTFQDGKPACLKFKIAINPDEDFCSWHIPESNITQCNICKKHIPMKETNVNCFEDKILLTCESCSSLLGTCHTCQYQNQCNFKSDYSEPQMVTKTIKQGMMIMQTQMKNPNLIQKHCLNCKCSYTPQGDCFKDITEGACPSWTLRPELLQ